MWAMSNEPDDNDDPLSEADVMLISTALVPQYQAAGERIAATPDWPLRNARMRARVLADAAVTPVDPAPGGS